MCATIPPAKALVGWILSAGSWPGAVGRGALSSFIAVALFAFVGWCFSIQDEVDEVKRIKEEVGKNRRILRELRADLRVLQHSNKRRQRQGDLAELIKQAQKQQENEK